MDRTDDEIDEQLNAAANSMESGRSKWPGMSYERGAIATTLR